MSLVGSRTEGVWGYGDCQGFLSGVMQSLGFGVVRLLEFCTNRLQTTELHISNGRGDSLGYMNYI